MLHLRSPRRRLQVRPDGALPPPEHVGPNRLFRANNFFEHGREHSACLEKARTVS
jgi:hypothetical protein